MSKKTITYYKYIGSLMVATGLIVHGCTVYTPEYWLIFMGFMLVMSCKEDIKDV